MTWDMVCSKIVIVVNVDDTHNDKIVIYFKWLIDIFLPFSLETMLNWEDL